MTLLHALRTAVVVTISALCAPLAVAQIVSPPNPIDYSELAGAVRDRGGGLDERAWESLRAAYVQYLNGCEALRVGDDAAAFREQAYLSEAKSEADMRREHAESLRRIRPQRTLDEALVAAVIAQLPESTAAARGPILRTWSERRWLLEVGSWNDRSASRTLPGELRRCRLNDADAVIVREAMDELEGKLVGLERKRFDVQPRAWQAMMAARRKLAPMPEGDEREAAVQQWYHDRRVLLRSTFREVREIERDIDEMVDHAIAVVLPKLSVPGRRMVIAVQLRIAFSDVPTGDPIDAIRDLRRWMSRTDLSPERRAEAQAMIDAWREEDDRCVGEVIRIARRWTKARFDDLIDPLPDGSDREDALNEEIEAASEKRDERAAALRERFASTFKSSEMSFDEELEAFPDKISADANDTLFADLKQEEEEATEEEAAEVPAGPVFSDTMWIGAPPRIEELREFTERFGLDPIRRAAFGAVVADFLEEWGQRIVPQVQLVDGISTYRRDGEPDATAPAQILAAGQAVRVAATESEEGLFDGLVALALPAERDALVTWRVAALLGSPSWAMNYRSHVPTSDGRYATSSRHTNIAMAIRQTQLAPEMRDVAEHVLAERATALERADRVMGDSEIAAHGAMLESRIRLETAYRTGAGTDEAAQAYVSDMQQIGKKLAHAASERIAIDDEIAKALAEKLAPDAAARIRRAHLRLCYPDLESDRQRLERTAARTLGLPSLDPARTARIAEAVERWSDEYDALTDRLAELGIEPRPDARDELMPSAEHEQKSSWLHFRRDQAGAALLHTITLALTEPERREIPHLPKP